MNSQDNLECDSAGDSLSYEKVPALVPETGISGDYWNEFAGVSLALENPLRWTRLSKIWESVIQNS